MKNQDLEETKRKLVSKSALRVVSLESINFDPAYQREVKGKHKRIVADFNKDALGIVLVGEREDGTLWGVDGLQRITAVKKLGHKTIRAEVFRSSGPEHEAEVFKLVNMNRVALNPQEQFKALLTAHDELAWSIKEAIEGAGFKIRTTSLGRTKGERGDKEVNAIKTLLQYCGRYGVEPLKFALQVLNDCWPNDRVGNSHNILAGLMSFYLRYDKVIDLERLRSRLQTTTPHKILYTAQQMVNPNGGLVGAVVDVIDKLYKKRVAKK